MPFLFYRLSRFLRLRLRGWRIPLAVSTFVFLTSWLAMSLVESADSDIAAPSTYWWYFVVTSATVGYGDVFPVSPAGRIVGLYVIVGGIVTLTLLFTQLATALQSIRGRRLRGVVPLDLSDHVVLLGYWPGRTERVVAELTAEGRFQVALCAWNDVPENPLPHSDAVHFVRGDLAHEDVMTRACVRSARTAVIAVPPAKRVGMIWNPQHLDDEITFARRAAQQLNIELVSFEVRDVPSFEKGLANAAASGVDSLFVIPSRLTSVRAAQIGAFGREHKLPVITAWREFAEADCLLSYGPNRRVEAQTLAAYMQRIMRGVKPLELPIQTPTKFEMVVNMRTAKAIGIAIPPSSLLRADEVIE